MTSVTPPPPSLRVAVVVIRSDGVIIKEIGWQAAMSKVIGMILQKLPSKRFGQDKRDEMLSEKINAAFQDYRLKQLKLGLQPWVWTHKK